MGLSYSSLYVRRVLRASLLNLLKSRRLPVGFALDSRWVRDGFAFGLAFLSALASLKFVLEQKSGF